MKKTLGVENKYFQYFSLIAALLTLPFLKGISQVSLTTLGAAYTQNFDGLASTGTSSVVPSGWAFSETGTNANTTYLAGTGSGTGGDTYSFGTVAADRAFGTQQSGSCVPALGASFTNNTGSTITSLDVTYIGEQWRFGATGRADQLNFEYSLNATSLTNGTWLPITALNFVTPNTSTVVGAVNGNITGNRTSVSSTIGSLSIAVGGTVWIRWTDVNATGSDDGLGIDDFSITPNGTAPTPPTKLAITLINPSSPLAGSGFSVTVQAQDVTNTPQNVINNTTFSLSTNGNAGSIGGTITGTINAGSSSVIISGVTLQNAGTNVDITATRTSGDVLSAATSSTFTVIGLATQLAFVGVPSSGYVSSDLAAFTIEARRADNSVDVNYNGTITVSKAGGPGTLSGTTSVVAVSGVATFSVLQFNQVGTYSLSTTSGTLTSSTSSSIIISPSPVTWNFTSPSATNLPANLTVSTMTTGNSYGSATMISSTSASSGYTGSSGGNNAGVPSFTGSINTATNAYYEFSLTPDPNYVVTLNGISFGTRATGTGPQAFSVRSSKDNYVADIATGTIANNSTWGLKTPSVNSISSTAGNIITFRIFGYNGTGNVSLNSINWRIDDVLLNITVSACTQPNISVNSGSICVGNSFTINPSGGVTYSVTGNSFTVNPTTNTNYTVTGADAIGCTNTVVSAVVVNSLPSISVNSGDICTGSSFTINPTGASTYSYSGGSNIVSPTTNSSYTVTGTDVNGCKNAAISSVNVNSLPSITVTSGAICTGSSFTISASGATSYVYSGGSNVVSPTTNTDYTVTGSDANGCENTAVSSVTVNSLPSITVNSGAICTGSSFTITPTGAVTYVYSSGSNVVNPTATTNYTVTGTTNGCSSDAVVTVSVNALPTISISGNTTGICAGSSVTLTASGGNTYVWNTGATTPETIVSPGLTTSYTVTGTDLNNCSNISVATVTTTTCIATTQLISSNCNSTLTVLDGSVRLYCNQVGGATNYEWQFTDVSTGAVVLTKQRGAQWTDFYLTGYWPTIQYNKTYSVKVRAYVGAWGLYGSSCYLTTPTATAIPTELVSTQCNSTLTTLDANTKLYCNAVTGATNYEWQFTDVATGTVVLTKQRAAQYNDFYLTGYFPNIQYNKTYSIKVRSCIGSSWSVFGNTCTLTTPAASPVPTKLIVSQCNITLPTLNSSTRLYCDAVIGATNYEWKFTSVSTGSVVLVKQRLAQYNDFYLTSYFPNIQFSTTYNVEIRSYVNNTWSAFGTICSIITPATATGRFAFSDTEETEIETSININTYPNPTDGILNIDFNNVPANASIEIYNMVGELVLTQQLTELNNTINTSPLANGLYHAKVIGNSKLLFAQKIVKQ